MGSTSNRPKGVIPIDSAGVVFVGDNWVLATRFPFARAGSTWYTAAPTGVDVDDAVITRILVPESWHFAAIRQFCRDAESAKLMRSNPKNLQPSA